jgi:hypothetical protein
LYLYFILNNMEDWSKMEKVASPDKWLEMYSHYQDILMNEDVAGFWNEQFEIANRERNFLKEKLEKINITILKYKQLSGQPIELTNFIDELEGLL